MTYRKIPIALLTAVCLCTPSEGRAQSASGPPSRAARAARPAQPTPETLKAIGQRLVDSLIKADGQVTDSAAVALVRSALDRIVNAAGVPGLRITWVITGSRAINAFAVPGSFVVVNIGLIDALGARALRDSPNDPVARRNRHEALLASALAHETAHITLGHVGRSYRGIPRSASERRALEARLADPKEQGVLRMSRRQETAADTIGALYLLRAGFGIQDALDAFAELDAITSKAGQSTGLTFMSSHPSWQQRAAIVEGFRGYLKLDQARFDDAVLLIRNGIALSRAVALLDTVLSHFPYFPAALHARGSALLLQWYQLTPIDSLRLQASVPIYSPRFAERIRGAAQNGSGARQLLANARASLRAAASGAALPYSLSTLSVLDAYAGAAASARTLADSALALMPDDIEVLNNYGVVRYLTGDRRGALAAFEAAVGRSDGSSVVAPLFNLGRVQLELGNADAARNALEAYASLDSRSDWSPVTRALLLRATSTRTSEPRAQSTQEIARSGLPLTPPSVMGLELDAPATVATRLLGMPDEIRDADDGMRIARWTSRGLTMLVRSDGTIRGIRLALPAAGAVDGVRVGDDMSQVVSRWGRPTIGGAGEYAYVRGAWVLELSATAGRIRELVLASTN